MDSTLRQLGTAFRTLLVLTIILGILYPLAVWAIGQVGLRGQANGSLITRNGAVVASRNIGQSFGTPGGKDAAATAQWFRSRPSATGDRPYDGLASSGSNWGPANPLLVQRIRDLRAAVAKEDGVPVSRVPADAVTASSSGLDPHISPAYASIQIDRVARTRGLPVSTVRRLVEENTEGRMWGFLGQPVVNVVTLNLALRDLERQ